ncbi:MAG: acyloxyacyl hydrolase [Gammaproteobacteria bacterium]|nr:acyloxyacyl hydrolase [Gammaproteobacteria bacterium]MCW5582911.1 acyloxyacyl hydrolase [Gammaproteobacteria bacterium]
MPSYMERLKLIFIIAVVLLLPSLSIAAPHYGATLSIAALSKEPSHLRGAQLMLNYDPQKFQWRQFNIYFDGGFSHFWTTNKSHYTDLNIYSVAPVIRYTFKKRGLFLPYLELSIGLSYLSRTRIDNRNLGIHFAFQDRIGMGTSFGTADQFLLGVHAVHYSNACLAEHNSGLSMPLVLDIGYRFS